MKKFLLNTASRLFGRSRPAGKFLGRARAADSTAITFRMGAGFPGDVNRTHPASIVPYMNDVTSPVAFYGEPVFATASNTVRGITAADTSNVNVFGIAVRPFPIQASSGTAYGGAALGAATPPAGAIDICKSGLIMSIVNGAPVLNGAVYVWSAASSGAHIQGGFEAANPSGNGFLITNAYFNGPPDANGNVEIAFNL